MKQNNDKESLPIIGLIEVLSKFNQQIKSTIVVESVTEWNIVTDKPFTARAMAIMDIFLLLGVTEGSFKEQYTDLMKEFDIDYETLRQSLHFLSNAFAEAALAKEENIDPSLN